MNAAGIRRALDWVLALAAVAGAGQAATFTYTPTTATESWSGGANWSAVPTSSAATELVFTPFNVSVLPNSLANVNQNNVADPFDLNTLRLQGTGPSSGAGMITIGGNRLRFVNDGSAVPKFYLDALSGSSGLTNMVVAPITLSGNTLFTGNGTATFRLAGALGGSGTLTKAGTSLLHFDADSSGSYSGAFTIRGGTLRQNINLGAKLPESLALSFDGSSGTFVYANATGGGAYTQTVAGVSFLSGENGVEASRPGGGNTFLAVNALSRSVGAVGALTVTAGSNPTNARITLPNASPGVLSAGLLYGGEYLFRDAAGHVRGINYASDSSAYATSGSQNTLAVTERHVQFTGGALATSTASGAGSGTSLTLASAANFAVGQPLTGTGIPKGTYIVAKSGNTLTLSQNNTVANGATVTPYAGVNAQETATVNTYKFATAGSGLRLGDGQTLTLSDGGVLFGVNTPVASVLSGGTGVQTPADGEFILNSASSINSWIVVGTPLLANGTNPLTKAGPGTVRMEAANTYAGPTFLLGGSLEAAIADNPGVGGPLGAGGAIHFFGGALRHSAANTYDYSGRFATAANQTFNIDPNGQTVTLAGNLQSAGGRLFANHSSGTLELNGNNTFDGGATFSGGGTLAIGSNQAFGTGLLAYTGGGVLRATDNSTRTLPVGVSFSAGSRTIGVNNAMLLGNLVFQGPVTLGGDVTFTIRSLNPSPGCGLVFEGAVADDGLPRTVTVYGATDGTGQGWLFLLGPNTYRGRTLLNTSGAAGPLVVNTLANAGEASSSLGAPSGSDRSIRMASANSSSSAAILRYIGGATSTDRDIEFGYAGNNTNPNTATLDASGTGALIWTGALTAPGGPTSSGAKNFRLDGTSTDANTFAGVLPDPEQGTGKLNLAKNGCGVWRLTEANTFTGGLAANAGTLVLDYASNAAIVNSANAVTLGGTLLFRAHPTNATAQTLGNLATSANRGARLVLDRPGPATLAVTLGNTWSRGGNSTLGIDLSSGATLVANPAASLSNGLIGWATLRDASGIGFATTDGTSVVRYTAGTPLTAGFATSTTANFTLAGDLTLSGASRNFGNSLEVTADGGTLDLNGLTLTQQGIRATLFKGSGGYTVANGAYVGAANEQIIHQDAAGVVTLSATVGSSSGSITKRGDGTLAMHGRGSTSALRIQGGSLRANGGSVVSAGVVIVADGGVLELGVDDFTGNLASTGAGNFQFAGDGGFAAYGVTRAVRLNGGTDTIEWGSANFVPDYQALVLGGKDANALVDFQNGLGLANAQRVVEVRNGSVEVDARLSGPLSSRYGGGLIKRGAGTLELTGANTYGGDTWVQAGELMVGSGTGGGLVTVFDGAALSGTGTVARLKLKMGGRLKVRSVDGIPAKLTVSGIASIGDGTIDFSDLGAVSASMDYILIDGPVEGEQFASVVGLPSNRTLQVSETGLVLKGTGAGTLLLVR